MSDDSSNPYSYYSGVTSDSDSSDSYRSEGSNYRNSTYSSEAGPGYSYSGNGSSQFDTAKVNAAVGAANDWQKSLTDPAFREANNITGGYWLGGNWIPGGSASNGMTMSQLKGMIDQGRGNERVSDSQTVSQAYGAMQFNNAFSNYLSNGWYGRAARALGLQVDPRPQDDPFPESKGSSSSYAAAAAAGAGLGGGSGFGNGLGIPSLGSGSGADSGMSDYWQGLIDQLQIGDYQQDPTGLVANAKAVSGYFNSDVMPQWGVMRDAVNQYNDAGYQGLMRNRAMVDVASQSAAAESGVQRSMLRRGVNPGSGAYTLGQGQRAAQTALAKVNAAAQSDSALRDAFLKGGTSLLSAGSDMAKSAAALGSVGLDAEKAQNAWGLSAAELGVKNRQGFASLALNDRNAVLDSMIRKYGIDNNVAINQSNQDNELLGTVLGIVFGGK